MKTTIGQLTSIINNKLSEYFGELGKVHNADLSKTRGLSFTISIAGTRVFYVYYTDIGIEIYTYFTGKQGLVKLFELGPAGWDVVTSIKSDTEDATRELKDRFVKAVLDELLNIECAPEK